MALTLLDLILIIIAAVAVFVLVAIYLGWIFGVLTQKPKTGAESLIGKLGTAESDILPEMGGDVNVDGIIWRAMLQENESSIERNSQVVVIRVSSLKLIVRKIKDGDQGK